MRRGYTDHDPTEGIKVGRAPRRAGVALTVDQARALLTACQRRQIRTVKDWRRGEWSQTFSPPEHLFLAVLVSLHTGLRQGNVLRLRWSQVDLAAGRITIPAEEMKARREHSVPIHPELEAVLRETWRARGKVEPGARVLGRELAGIRRSFHGALAAADLPPIRWHDLRHTFATWVSSRTTFAVLQRLLGHSPGSVTLGYTHVPWEELERAIRGMPELLEPDQEQGRDSAGTDGSKAPMASR